MKEQIVEQIVKARQEAIMWANHEIKAIAVKYQGRKDKKELLEAELLKAREFQDSAVGNGYINSLAPIYENDETLVSAIANYYMSSKVVTNPDTRTGWTEESTQKYVYDDSFTFLRRYYLASYLSLILFHKRYCNYLRVNRWHDVFSKNSIPIVMQLMWCIILGCIQNLTPRKKAV